MEINKILMIIPKNTSGGAERVMVQLANYFSNSGKAVILLNFDDKSNFYPVDSKVNWIKMGIIFKSNKKWMKLFEAPLREWQRFKYINNLIKKERPDIVMPFLEMAEFLVIPNCIITNTQFCTSLRNDYKSYPFYLKWLIKLTYGKAKVIVCQTKAVADDLLKIVKCNTLVIPNPLDINTYIVDKRPIVRRNVIINVGRLTSQKNQKLLITAFYQIAKEFPEYELHIYGEGELQEELEELIKKMDFNNRVKLMGVTPNCLALNNDVKLFVMSSDYEGYPNTLVEAMANNIPVISTSFATKAANEILKNGECGILVPVRDVSAMADAIRYALNNYEEMSNKAEKGLYIRERLNTDVICKTWLNIIEKSNY